MILHLHFPDAQLVGVDADLLSSHVDRIDTWHTIYYHLMLLSPAIADCLRATPDASQQDFLQDFLARIDTAARNKPMSAAYQGCHVYLLSPRPDNNRVGGAGEIHSPAHPYK
ncbi:hypothetical protein [Yersinia aldovae]|uniref:hypothetical protein n=1 Tax=Yersinia aldovae TaxID=29483 RepID=UPI0011A1D864|nr:hypothetical protein [Yersinia aldovae]